MLYRYIITPESPLRTDVMSDTMFGHFCWAVRYREGETYLSDFLDSYDQAGPAPVLFSSGFPSGCLPRPTLPSPPRKLLTEFIGKLFKKEDEYKGLAHIKKSSKRRFITEPQWQKLKNGYSDLELYEAYFHSEGKSKPDTIEEITASNMINRISGTVQEGGGLFHRVKTWYPPGAALDLYAEIANDEMISLVNWFLCDYLPAAGYGADKSVGMGCVRIKPDQTFDPQQFHVENASARLSLSLASFQDMASINASYRLMTKFGKLGGSYAFFSPTGGNPKPFKKPILMYEPGAVFFCTHALNDQPLLKHVHSDAAIRHCGIPVTLPFICKEV